jgi:uncharacterized protein
MKKKIVTLLLISVFGICCSVFPQDTPIPEFTKNALSEILSENFSALYARFDEKMKAAMPEDTLKETLKTLFIQVGSFKSQVSFLHKKSGDYDIFTATCQFEIAALDIELVFNPQQKISGLFFKPAASTIQKRPQNPKKPYPYHEEEVIFESRESGIKLSGTLTFPESGGPFPAVVLISGSGAQDRNEELMGHKPFLVLSDYLTRHGIAVLRFDDRGVGGSTTGSSGDTTDNFAIDVMGGTSYLKTRKEIDSKNIGLIGHSEGGMIAPLVAAKSSDIAFIVMMAGTGVPGEDILKLQGELIMRANGAPEEMIKENARVQKVMLDIIKTTTDKEIAKEKIREALSDLGPGKLDAIQTQLYTTMSPWMRFFINFDPKTALEKVKCPVLALNGEKDLQVSPAQNLPEIEKALIAGKNKDYKIIELPGLNHLFQTCKTGSVAEYAQIEETISPNVLELITSWILEHATQTRIL